MAVPASGELTFKGLHNELVEDDYDSTSTPSGRVTMYDMINSNNASGSSAKYEAINSNSTSRPDAGVPYTMGDWYGYDHDASSVVSPPYTAHMADDFYGDATTYTGTSRDSYSTTTWQNTAAGYPNMSDNNSKTVSDRPTWSGFGVEDVDNSILKLGKAANNANWHNSVTTFDRIVDTTDFDTGALSYYYNHTFNVQFRVYMKTGGNKDINVYLHSGDTSKPSSIGNAGNWVRCQFMDNSDSSYPRKIRLSYKYNGTVTHAAYSSTQFSTNTWYTVTFSYQTDNYMDNKFKVFASTTDGSVGSEFVGAGAHPYINRFYGLTLMTVKNGNNDTDNRFDWIRCWRSGDWPS